MFQIAEFDNDYMALNNKPAINGVTLQGNMTLTTLGITSISNAEIDAITA